MSWYDHHRRKLPWRKTSDPYKIWVSEVMLQQTTVPAVLPYYRNWIRLFPDIRTLARARPQQVLKAWEGLGYYERARNLHRAARLISAGPIAAIPQTYEELSALPGFGPYTTAAVLSIAFGQPYPVLDANIRRTMMRVLAIKKNPDARTEKRVSCELARLMPGEDPGKFNQAMMELGALVCRPRNPRCLLCPVRRFCRAYERGEQEVIPPPRKRIYSGIDSVVGIIWKSGRVLIQKRPASGLLAGLWEFPGGKRKRGETLEEALHRELREELGVQVRTSRFFLKVRHAYTRFLVTLYAFECRLANSPRLKRSSHRWVALPDLKRYPFPSGSAKIVRFLEQKEKRRLAPERARPGEAVGNNV